MQKQGTGLQIILLVICIAATQVQSSVGKSTDDDLSVGAWDYPYAAKSKAKWVNSAAHLPHTVNTSDGSQVRAILLRNPNGYGFRYACGFICNGTCDTFLFSVFALYINSGSGITWGAKPQIVWTANRARPVHENATLRITPGGNLRLTDVDGTLVWSAGTAGKGVASVQLHKNGNLILANGSNKTVWQSWDYPTDTLLPGQRLRRGQRLVGSVSATDARPGRFYLGLEGYGLGLYKINVKRPIFNPKPYWKAVCKTGAYAVFNVKNGSLEVFRNYGRFLAGSSGRVVDASAADKLSPQFVRVDPDGVLKIYGGYGYNAWQILYSAGPKTPNLC